MVLINGTVGRQNGLTEDDSWVVHRLFTVARIKAMVMEFSLPRKKCDHGGGGVSHVVTVVSKPAAVETHQTWYTYLLTRIPRTEKLRIM